MNGKTMGEDRENCKILVLLAWDGDFLVESSRRMREAILSYTSSPFLFIRIIANIVIY